ncbi:hypothetical protein BBJ28_00008888, partial [Nothophytophthora sp. Chile5]
KMTGTTQAPAPAPAPAVPPRNSPKKMPFFRAIKPTPVGSPSAIAKKMLHTRRLRDASGPEIESERLPEEAQELKDLLRASATRHGTRFSFSRLRRVVVPPVEIPVELAIPNAVTNLVAGVKIPMTKAMWQRHRERLVLRLPVRVDEACAA